MTHCESDFLGKIWQQHRLHWPFPEVLANVASASQGHDGRVRSGVRCWQRATGAEHFQRQL